MSRGWIGVDLDGTLAQYDGWKGPTHIGAPVEKMVERVKGWLAEGKTVKVLTARVSDRDPRVRADIEEALTQWTHKHIGRVLPTTCTKDYAMIELWDDRAVQVIPNTGQRADGQP